MSILGLAKLNNRINLVHLNFLLEHLLEMLNQKNFIIKKWLGLIVMVFIYLYRKTNSQRS